MLWPSELWVFSWCSFFVFCLSTRADLVLFLEKEYVKGTTLGLASSYINFNYLAFPFEAGGAFQKHFVAAYNYTYINYWQRHNACGKKDNDVG